MRQREAFRGPNSAFRQLTTSTGDRQAGRKLVCKAEWKKVTDLLQDHIVQCQRKGSEVSTGFSDPEMTAGHQEEVSGKSRGGRWAGT